MKIGNQNFNKSTQIKFQARYISTAFEESANFLARISEKAAKIGEPDSIILRSDNYSHYTTPYLFYFEKGQTKPKMDLTLGINTERAVEEGLEYFGRIINKEIPMPTHLGFNFPSIRRIKK